MRGELADSLGPDQTALKEQSDQGLHCLAVHLFGCSYDQKKNTTSNFCQFHISKCYSVLFLVKS